MALLDSQRYDMFKAFCVFDLVIPRQFSLHFLTVGVFWDRRRCR